MADKKPEKENPQELAGKDKAAQAAGDESASEPKKRKSLPKPLIIAAVVIVQIIGAYFLQKTLFFKDVSAAVQHEEAKSPKKEEHKKGKHGAEESSNIVMLDEIVVNPARSGGRRYLAVTVGFQTEAPEADKLFEKNKPLIRDALISLFSSKELEKLADISYRDSLKLEIKEGVNRQLRDSVVTQVVFSSYVLQ